MSFLIIFVLCILAATKVLIQSRYAKNNTKGIADAAIFNGIVFAAMGALALTMTDIRAIDLTVISGAAVYGILSITFQVTYQIALSCGPTSITALIASLASTVPLLVSAAVYKEPLSAVNAIGVVLIIITLVMNADIKKDFGAVKGKSAGKKWFLFTILAFSANALGMIAQQMFAKKTGAAHSSAFVACASVTASLFAFALYAVLRAKGQRMSYKMNFRKAVPCITVGIVLGVFQIIHTHAMAVIPGTVLFPTYSAGATIAIALGSTFVFREKLSIYQRISLVIGIVAIVLINI